MRTICTRLVHSLASLAFSPLAAVAADNVTCPSEIQQSSLKLVDVPGQWTPHVARPIFLHGAGAAAGPPDSHGQLKPENSTYAEGKTSWKVTYNLEGDFPRGKWLECSYGTLNQLILSKRLPNTTSTCKVSYRKGEHAGQNNVDIACR
ncbi:STY0301 family protein [Massilia polaris]|uniref:STY0301 family protein n=1 Tax=Massilia polaris TaxID=2728846 RepID=UPI00351D11B9